MASTHNRKILELWSPALHLPAKNPAGAPATNNENSYIKASTAINKNNLNIRII